MYTLKSLAGVTISYEKHGSGPPLVLVHGAFSDHRTNWEFVLPYFEKRFAVYAIARRGRGATSSTQGHSLEDEARDVAALILSIGEPVFLLGHSYGAHTALAAAALVPSKVRKLVLYEAPWPRIVRNGVLEPLASKAQAGDWNGFTISFFHQVLFVPMEELEALQRTELWPPIISDAKASLADLRALSAYRFKPESLLGLRMPVLLQIGTESPRHLYVTDKLSAILCDVRVQALDGQAHEAMTTAPEMYAKATASFLLERSSYRERYRPQPTVAAIRDGLNTG
jgi:pimeloyl-ACP methyl ester carboxylesterase